MARLVIATVLLLLQQLASLSASGGEATATESVKAMYVFGDSYVDTGNTDPDAIWPANYAWNPPFGFTWPGYPTGRFSDGRVLTDAIACYLGLPSPIPFRTLNISMSTKGREIQNYEGHTKARVKASWGGVNFAYGGSGVFTTPNSTVSNITTQIEDFSIAVDLGYVPVEELPESLVLFSVNGNDYLYYLLNNFTSPYPSPHQVEPDEYINQVVEQMALDIENLVELGFTNFFVTNVGPVEKYPFVEEYFKNRTIWLEIFALVISEHNNQLANLTSTLSMKYPNSSFFILDLHKAFTTVIDDGILSLDSCCDPAPGSQCGGNYTLCANVNAALFWDAIHPTQSGWFTLVKAILPDLPNCYNLQQQAFAKI